MFKKFFVFFVLTAFSTPSFAAWHDGFHVKSVLRYKLESDFVADTTKNDFDLSYFQVTKSFGDNFSLAFAPGIIRSSSVNSTTGIRHDLQNFVLYAAYFKFNDVTKSYGDYGIGLTGGQYFSPFYKMEQHYQPFKFIEKPLDFRLFPNNIVRLGVMLSKNFIDDAIRTSVAYIAGSGAWNSELYTNSVLNDNVNAGGIHLMTTFFPFRKMGPAIKELSLTFNITAIGRTSARSSYNFLLGYMYDRFATSIEYIGTYSSDSNNQLAAISFGASCDVWGPLQVLFRYDYSDLNNTAVTYVTNPLNHFILGGINTKWLDGKFQVAATFDVNYEPTSKTATSKRFMLATQTAL